MSAIYYIDVSWVQLPIAICMQITVAEKESCKITLAVV